MDDDDDGRAGKRGDEDGNVFSVVDVFGFIDGIAVTSNRQCVEFDECELEWFRFPFVVGFPVGELDDHDVAVTANGDGVADGVAVSADGDGEHVAADGDADVHAVAFASNGNGVADPVADGEETQLHTEHRAIDVLGGAGGSGADQNDFGDRPGFGEALQRVGRYGDDCEDLRLVVDVRRQLRWVRAGSDGAADEEGVRVVDVGGSERVDRGFGARDVRCAVVVDAVCDLLPTPHR